MVDETLTPFEDPSRHAGASEIIKRHSTSHTDVREAVLHGLDLSSAKAILDLGCGIGFMTEAVAKRASPDAEIVGVDACPANERPYLARVSRAGRTGRFVCQELTDKLDWPDRGFDLVLASYSLYFFPDIVPEIARVLKEDGRLLVVTHTEQSCRDLLHAVGLPEAGSRLLAVIHNFSADNAGATLARWFASVERIDYRNSLVFSRHQFDDFLQYIWFKLPFLAYESEPDGGPAGPLAQTIRAALAERTRLEFEKSDAAFHCRKPR